MTIQRIGRYSVVGLVGTGGFATIYRARDERLDDTVAVKVLAENHSLDPQMRERFISEGRVLRRASDPHLVAVHDLGETEVGQPYLVLEYADGGDLSRRVDGLRREGYEPDGGDLHALVCAVGAAVEALHRLSIVHRDLSPANLLLKSGPATRSGAGNGRAVLAPDERLLLADLGLCKDLARHSGLTLGGGTDGFCPPEQRRGRCTVDERADIWALSALVVWLATGQPPDPAGTWRETMAAGGSPPALLTTLSQSLAEDPADRPPTVAGWRATVLHALHRWAPPGGAVPPGDRPSRPSGRRRPARAVALVSLVLVLVVVLVTAGDVANGRWRRRPQDGTTSTRPAGPGLIRAAAHRGRTDVSIVGPPTVRVGDVPRFHAEVRGARSWAWLAPDGAVRPDPGDLAVTTVTPGEALIHVVAVAADGGVLRATLRLRVDAAAR